MNTVGYVAQRSLMPNTDDEPLDCSTARSLFDLRLHRQNGFALEPGAQSGFGHYQAQEVRTLAWLKS